MGRFRECGILKKTGGFVFSEIEKEYKKGLQQKRFLTYYWPFAVVIVVIAVILDFVFNFNRWLVYCCAVVALLAAVIGFFARESRQASRSFQAVRDGRGMLAKMKAYFAADDERRLANLIDDLAQHHICTKDDIALALDYYQKRLPDNSRPNLLSWVLTAMITLVSIVVVAYDDSIGAINVAKLVPIMISAFMATLIILTPFIIAKIISAIISSSRNKVETILVEDLAYIYINYERYRRQLEEAKK